MDSAFAESIFCSDYSRIHSINLSFISGDMIQKRIYLLSKNGKVEQSRIIIFWRIARRPIL